MIVDGYRLLISTFLLILLAACSVIDRKSDDEQAITVNQQIAEQGALKVCSPDAGPPFSYRKTLLVAGTQGVSDLTRDLPGLGSLTSQRLQTHLEALGRFNVRAIHDTSFDSSTPDTASRVQHLGRQYDSQFVVKIELQDMTIHSARRWLAGLSGVDEKRDVAMTLYLYDAEYGALFHSQAYERHVTGNVVGYPGGGSTVTTAWFRSDLGLVIDQILLDMSMLVNEKLACVPFSTNVLSVRGDDVRIGAGYLHGIRPGDKLRIYRRADFTSLQESAVRDINEGWIQVRNVLPDNSIATLLQSPAGEGRAVGVGDVVRAW